jgi:hypothetical protein
MLRGKREKEREGQLNEAVKNRFIATDPTFNEKRRSEVEGWIDKRMDIMGRRGYILMQTHILEMGMSKIPRKERQK